MGQLAHLKYPLCQQVFSMWLACHTQQEIADAAGWSVQSVNNEIATFSNFHDSGKIGKSAQNLANHETESVGQFDPPSTEQAS
jgi:hypothetical protein